MKKRSDRSLVNHMLVNNFSIIITAVLVVLLTVFIALCTYYRSGKIADARTQLAQSVASMRYAIEERIHQSDFMVRNTAVMSHFDDEFDDNYELVRFMNEFSLFLDSLDDTENATKDNFIIYTDNSYLVNSGHVLFSTNLKDFEKICEYSKSTMQYYYWSDLIREDISGRTYITLYRYIPRKYNCIAEMKIYTDASIPAKNPYNITLVKSEYTDSLSSLRFAEELPGGFSMTASITRGMLVKQYAYYALLLLLLGIIFLIVLYLLANRSVNRTMNDVLELIKEIETDSITEGDREEQWKEVNIIKTKISDMTRKLSESASKEYEQELLRRKLEIEVLNSKINPHIIYNSLSAIKLVAFKENMPAVSNMTDILIDYYRLVLNKGEDTISVALEMEYLEKYIDIYEISKKTAYDVEYDVPSDALDLRIPHLLLQPIVENAILHGLNTSKEPKISIKVRLDGDKLIITVTDNGVGIEPDRLRQLNSGENIGYGLGSVLQRAGYYYGGDFEFSISSLLDKGTSVTLTILKEMKSSI